MQVKKQILFNSLAKTIKKYRGSNSITKLSYEVDVSKSIWSKLEQGERDVQLSTLWKIAEALNIKISELLQDIELDLGEEFSFIEDM